MKGRNEFCVSVMNRMTPNTFFKIVSIGYLLREVVINVGGLQSEVPRRVDRVAFIMRRLRRSFVHWNVIKLSVPLIQENDIVDLVHDNVPRVH